MNIILLLTALAVPIAGRTILDLTHTLDNNSPSWPLEGFGVFNTTTYKSSTLYADDSYGGVWIELKKVEYYEHMGTHIDAPSNFGKGRHATHEIPPEKLIGPGIMIEVRDQVAGNPNYVLTVEDIKKFEEKHGRIPRNAIVMLNTGWAEKYHDPKLNFGTEDPSDASTFNFPGYSLDACKMLLAERQINVLGIDTSSLDPAGVLACHVYLQNNDVPLLEYVANLDTMPATGTTVFLGSPKHRGGSGGPTRIFAIIEDDDDGTSAAVRAQTWISYLVLFALMCFFV